MDMQKWEKLLVQSCILQAPNSSFEDVPVGKLQVVDALFVEVSALMLTAWIDESMWRRERSQYFAPTQKEKFWWNFSQ
jgi:hypothetical protein